MLIGPAVKPLDFKAILDANLEELTEWVRSPSLARSWGEGSGPGGDALALYAQVIRSYLLGDTEALEAAVAKLPVESSLRAFGELRSGIRRCAIPAEVLEKVRSIGQIDEKMRGEAYFLVALAYEVLGLHQEVRDFYGRAYESLEKIGAGKKAIKALLSFVAAEGRLDPNRKLISDYFFVYKKAIRKGVPSAAGVALLNISREYQKLQAHSVALKFAHRAVAKLQHEMGSRPYFLAIAHRCHVFMEMGRWVEARLDYETLKACPLTEGRGALEILAPHFEKAERAAPLAHESKRACLTPSWRERERELSLGKRHRASMIALRPKGLEEKLLEVLSKGSRDRFELIETLYGKGLDFVVLENRLNNLLNRVRKKNPGLIVFQQGRYFLSDPSFLGERSTQKADPRGAAPRRA